MASHPFISVVVTTHRRPMLLARCLDSLLDQDFEDFEILLCADESSPETRAVASGQLRESDSFLVLPGRKGPAATRNAGLSQARGKWVCFLDDDDTFDSMHLEHAVPLLEADKAVVHYTNYLRIQEERGAAGATEVAREKILLRQFPVPITVCNSIPNNAFFAPRVLATSCRFDETLHSHEDWEYLLALSSRAELRYHDLWGPQVHILVDATSRNLSPHRDGSVVLDFLSVYRRWPAATPELQQARQQFIAGMGLQLPADFL